MAQGAGTPIRTTELVEVHGNDGSPFAAARTHIRHKHGQVVVTETRYTGERCEHGSLLVAVTFMGSP